MLPMKDGLDRAAVKPLEGGIIHILERMQFGGAVHAKHFIDKAGDKSRVMGDQDKCQAFMQGPQLLEKTRLAVRIHHGCRLIQQQQFRIVDEGAGDKDPLLHASGEVDEALPPVRPELHFLKRTLGSRAILTIVKTQSPVVEAAHADNAFHIDRKKGIHLYILRHVADPATGFGRFATEDVEDAPIDRHESQKRLQEGAFPTAVRTDNAHHPPLGKGKGDLVEDHERSKANRQVVAFDEEAIGHRRLVWHMKPKRASLKGVEKVTSSMGLIQ